MEEPQTTADCPRCRALEAQIAKLAAELEEVRRAGKRQAAPFRKPKKPKPRKPGRKPGKDYGKHERRVAPSPEEIDETHDAPLPPECPRCGSAHVQETHVAQQFQVDLPQRPIHRQFNIHIGRCQKCNGRVQGRHELQTSSALGAAAAQLGPNAHVAMALLNKELGLSHGKVARMFELMFNIRVARATSARSSARTSRRCEQAYAELRSAVKASSQVVPDETGWRVGGENAWLHVVVGDNATCFEIDPTRSRQPVERLLGMEWSGLMVHDGWSVYRKFDRAVHQQCTNHLLKRCHELLAAAIGGAVRFPRQVKHLLKQGLAFRDRHENGEVSRHGLLVMAGRLKSQMLDLVFPVKTHPGNETLANFLYGHLDELFAYLRHPGKMDATNYRAEQAIRPAVVNRKVWGGNRTWLGARVQSILASVIRTCHQRLIEPFHYLANVLTSPQPPPLPLPS